MTATEAFQLATQQLAADPHLRDSARRDAELLLLHTLTITKAALLANPTRALTTEQQNLYASTIARRLRHEPIQYITGTQEFFGLSLRVTPAVLIPRPETEHLVEAVLQRLPHDRPLAIADIGTGSGAIAIALAAHLPQTHVTALDLSAEALRVAQSNAAEHGLAHRISFLLSDRLTAIPPPERAQHFDAIVSNPPYVPTADAASLHPQVREHEPALALFAGPDGLDLYRLLIPQARRALKPGGLLALEIGHGQRDDLARLLAGWVDITFVDDLQGIPRVALARR
ncbi:peptide chain release factor N(5)-glutamine methyltransferase [Edaphobacter aggregans]|uniref:peptide chain release factor N(5)-glutamine methyltransferase n=1 Tax=Edaphobacter aggregans TaxID=570835 RepID=UPI00054EE45D|nr:peptide chain release factor N(5)-glutamine methyltransferase [Edaphobacter aggregans]